MIAACWQEPYALAMPVSAEYETYLQERLRQYGMFSFRRMFGGLGIYRDEIFFGIVDNDRLFFRVSLSDRTKFEARGMGAFSPIPGKPPMRSYYEVPEEVLSDQIEFSLWILDAIAAAIEAKNSKKPKTARAVGYGFRRENSKK